MNDDCLFCQIVSGKIPSKKVHEDEQFFCFHDISPQAPTHILVVPKQHIASLDELESRHATMLGELMLLVSHLARQLGIVEGGYRTVVNCGEGAGQSVFHIHFHLLGGRPMRWPPG